MKIKIINKDTETCRFLDVIPGNIFYHYEGNDRGRYYMKLNLNSDNAFTAVDIINGNPTYFTDDNTVRKIDAELIINDPIEANKNRK